MGHALGMSLVPICNTAYIVCSGGTEGKGRWTRDGAVGGLGGWARGEVWGAGELGLNGVGLGLFCWLGGGIGFDWVCFGFVFLGCGEVIIFVSLFGVRCWVGFGGLGIGFVLHKKF